MTRAANVCMMGGANADTHMQALFFRQISASGALVCDGLLGPQHCQTAEKGGERQTDRDRERKREESQRNINGERETKIIHNDQAIHEPCSYQFIFFLLSQHELFIISFSYSEKKM